MKRVLSFVFLTGAFLVSAGCDKQTKLTIEQIAEQTHQLTVLQENQAKQIAKLQAQLTELGPRLDTMNNAYFEKSYTDAFFFHTNTLYLILAVDRQIESALKGLETRQQTEHDLAYSYQTNLLAVVREAQAESKLAFIEQSKQLETNLVEESHLIAAELSKQIQELTPDAEELSRRQQLVTDLRQIKDQLTQLATRLGVTNSPTVK